MSEHFQYLKEGLVVDLVDRVMTEYHLDLEKALDVVYSSEISRNSPTLPPAFSKKARHTSTPTLKTNSEKEKFKQRVHRRNFGLQKMFSFIGYVERAGSGADTITKG